MAERVRTGRVRTTWPLIASALLAPPLLAILIIQSRRHTGLEPGPYVRGREWDGAGAGVQSTHTDSDYVDLGEPEESTPESVEAATTSEIGSKS